MKVICTTLKSYTQEERKLKVIHSSAVSESGPELRHISGTVLRLMGLQGMGRTMRGVRMPLKTPFRNAEDGRRQSWKRKQVMLPTDPGIYPPHPECGGSQGKKTGDGDAAEGKGKLWQRIGMQNIVAKKISTSFSSLSLLTKPSNR